MTQRWEYRLVSFYQTESNDSAEDMANRLGAEGWELVAIDRQERWAFKRPLGDARPDLRVTRPVASLVEAAAVKSARHVRRIR